VLYFVGAVFHELARNHTVRNVPAHAQSTGVGSLRDSGYELRISVSYKA
jgi:hypothetical protein